MNILLFLSVTWCVTASAIFAPYYDLEYDEHLFEEFIQLFEKEYAHVFEKLHRFQIFKSNLERINHLNNMSEHTVFGITQFMDLSPLEFEMQYMGRWSPMFPTFQQACTVRHDSDIPNTNAPASWDWRQKGVVTSVKNQKNCGSCYAFSTVGHLESQYLMKYGKELDLSEQQIVDCDRRANGCNGGYMSRSFRSLIEAGGIMQEADYPYMGRQGQCRFNRNKVAVKVTDCFSYSLRSQDKLKQLLYKSGTISIGIQAFTLQWYTGGIMFDGFCSGRVNHAVLLVGYGIENNVPYWIVKNSWGKKWGENGYLRVHRGEGTSSCGIMYDNDMSTAIIA